MKRISLIATLCLLVAALAAPTTTKAASTKLDRDLYGPHVSGRAILGFSHDVDAATIARLAKAGIASAVVLDTIDAVGVQGPLASYERIARWDDVTYVDADSRVRFDNYGAKVDTKVTNTRKGNAPLRRGYTGKGVTVGVIDTGIDTTHPDLTDRVVKHVNFEPSWFMDMIHDGKYSDQLSEATGNGIDSYGHGTHVAGTVAGSGAGGQVEDFSGVANETTLVNLKIADAWQGATCDVPCDFGWEINALVAYEWAIENRNDPAFPGGLRVLTNSWGIYEVDSEVEPITLIVQAAHRKGIVNVFAAGNDGPGANTVNPGPNAVEEVITVGATCKTAGYSQTTTCKAGEVAGFSSRGPQVDIAAPGVGIWSAMARHSIYGISGLDVAPPGQSDPGATANNASLYVPLSGTSMATPHVAGIVALMLQANPRLTPSQVEALLIKTATDKGKRGFDNDYGFGFVNAHKAVAAAIAAAQAKKRR